MLLPQALFDDKTILGADSKNKWKAQPKSIDESKHDFYIQTDWGDVVIAPIIVWNDLEKRWDNFSS